jgi:hypothetical protein
LEFSEERRIKFQISRGGGTLTLAFPGGGGALTPEFPGKGDSGSGIPRGGLRLTWNFQREE